MKLVKHNMLLGITFTTPTNHDQPLPQQWTMSLIPTVICVSFLDQLLTCHISLAPCPSGNVTSRHQAAHTSQLHSSCQS